MAPSLMSRIYGGAFFVFAMLAWMVALDEWHNNERAEALSFAFYGSVFAVLSGLATQGLIAAYRGGWRTLAGCFLTFLGGAILIEEIGQLVWNAVPLSFSNCVWAALFLALGLSALVLGHRRHSTQIALPYNQPLHPDALTRAGERQR